MAATARRETWDQGLRKQLRRQYGTGLRLQGKNNATQFGIRGTTDKAGCFVVLPFEFVPSNAQAISGAVARLLLTMEEQKVGLKEAHSRCFAEAMTPEKKTALATGVAYVEWEAVAEAFLESRQDNRGNTKVDTASRVRKALKTLQSKPQPRDGGSLMRAYAKQHFAKTPPGGQGRKRGLGDVAAFLLFAVQKHGADASWLPLEGEERQKLIGTKDVANAEDTRPIKPEQLAGFLDDLQARGKHELKLAVALVGLFGLRPCELAVLQVRDGILYVGNGVKRNPQTKNKPKPPRSTRPLDIKGRYGEGDEALRLFATGEVKLPLSVLTQIKQCVNKRGEVITDQGLKCVGDSFRQLLDRDPYWQQLQGLHGLTSYSLRHGYAWRAHKCGDRPMAPRDAAALMGHDPTTHQKHYGRWVDEQGLDDALAKWLGQ